MSIGRRRQRSAESHLFPLWWLLSDAEQRLEAGSRGYVCPRQHHHGTMATDRKLLAELALTALALIEQLRRRALTRDRSWLGLRSGVRLPT